MSDIDRIKALEARLAALEAEGAIRKTVARYMEICDALTADSPMEELGLLFTEDAVWEGKGGKYEDAFGGHIGRKAIVDFLQTYAVPPHFANNVHFLTTEVISVDGNEAQGSWVMLQTPTFSEGSSFALAARLNIGFRDDGEGWQIARFATENLLGRKMDAPWKGADALPVPPK